MERTWTKPAIAVLGIDAPRVAEASNVLSPAHGPWSACASAPATTPRTAQKALAEHLTAQRAVGRARHGDAGRGHRRAVLAAAAGAAYDVARRTFAAAYGNEVVEVGIGGSIPFIAEFARTFPGAAVLVTGVGDPASRWHGIDESLDLGMFARGVLAEALFLAELAR